MGNFCSRLSCLNRSLGKEGLCNTTVFETTRDLVYCVQTGIHYDKTRRPNSPSLKGKQADRLITTESFPKYIICHCGTIDISDLLPPVVQKLYSAIQRINHYKLRVEFNPPNEDD